MHSSETTDIFLFNPTCEYAVANGQPFWQANRLLLKMEADLATLPCFFANPYDIILTDKIPSNEFVESFEPFHFSMPQFFQKDEFLRKTFSETFGINKLLPWGWSPAAHRLLSPLKQYCSDAFKQSPVFLWNPENRELYSKGFALEILKEIKSALNFDFLLPENLITEKCTTREEIERLMLRWGKVMIKAPWSSSGRGLQPITKTPVHEKVWEKIVGIIKAQGFVIAEPYLNKAADLAFQFEFKKGKVEFVGISNFTTDKKGQYQGNYIHGIPDNFEPDVVEFAEFVPSVLIDPIIKILEKSKLAANYEGNFGVDTLIFRDESNKLKINPCLEINVRLNMGLLALYLEKLVSPEKKAEYRTYFQPGISFYEFKTAMQKKYPARFLNGKLESGFFALTEANENIQFGAYLLI